MSGTGGLWSATLLVNFDLKIPDARHVRNWKLFSSGQDSEISSGVDAVLNMRHYIHELWRALTVLYIVNRHMFADNRWGRNEVYGLIQRHFDADPAGLCNRARPVNVTIE